MLVVNVAACCGCLHSTRKAFEQTRQTHSTSQQNLLNNTQQCNNIFQQYFIY